MERKCPKCQTEMKPGIIAGVDSNGLSFSTRRLIWLEGPVKNRLLGGVKSSSHNEKEIVDYACSQCGFIESYIEG